MTSARDRTRALNDDLRIHHRGGRVMITTGVQALPPEEILRIDTAVSGFAAFDKSNDPYGEHDCGVVKVGSHTVIFKIDYYDEQYTFHSLDPSDPAVTRRVLTIMLADEY